MPSETSPRSQGHLLATLLSGSWRPEPPPLQLPREDLERAASLAITSGVAGLVSWRMQRSSLSGAEQVVRLLKRAYLRQTMASLRHQDGIRHIFEHLRSAGVEPLLVKGWANARLYPDAGLRPYTDYDVYVSHDDYHAALAQLPALHTELSVDLHEGVPHRYSMATEGVLARSRLVPLGDAQIRVPAAEDALRITSLHLMTPHHAGWRPLWLCDVAALLESLPARFDWDLCLGRDRRLADWLIGTIGLAHVLLGARIDHLPVREQASRIPRWLAPALLRQWDLAPAHHQGPPFATHLGRRPGEVLRALRQRWPNPLDATLAVRAPFNDAPRAPFQLGCVAFRSARLTYRLARAALVGRRGRGETLAVTPRVSRW